MSKLVKRGFSFIKPNFDIEEKRGFSFIKPDYRDQTNSFIKSAFKDEAKRGFSFIKPSFVNEEKRGFSFIKLYPKQEGVQSILLNKTM